MAQTNSIKESFYPIRGQYLRVSTLQAEKKKREIEKPSTIWNN